MKQPKPRPYPMPGQSIPTAEPSPKHAGEDPLDLLKEIYEWTKHKDTPWCQRTFRVLKAHGKI